MYYAYININTYYKIYLLLETDTNIYNCLRDVRKIFTQINNEKYDGNYSQNHVKGDKREHFPRTFISTCI